MTRKSIAEQLNFAEEVPGQLLLDGRSATNSGQSARYAARSSLAERNPSPLLLSPREAATALGISERTLWSLTQSGNVPSLRIGRLVKYRPESLVAWLAAKEKGGKTDA